MLMKTTSLAKSWLPSKSTWNFQKRYYAARIAAEFARAAGQTSTAARAAVL